MLQTLHIYLTKVSVKLKLNKVSRIKQNNK